MIKGESTTASASGNGPVNALDAALRTAIGGQYPSLSGVHLTDYRVRVLDTGRGTGAVTRVLVDSSSAERSWTTIGVSENIIEASWQALYDSIVFGLLVVRAMVVPVLAHGSLGVLGGGTRPRTIAGFFLVVFEMIAPASLLFLLLFWAVLHSWLNAWAYLLRFADRRWYGPWWQSRTWGEFYREWNVVVGEWIGAYLFLDLQRGCGRLQRSSGCVVVGKRLGGCAQAALADQLEDFEVAH
jgi:hypothetical protein